MNHDEPDTVSFEANRESAANDHFVRCPRCNNRIFMHDCRCEYCGVHFEGEAWQFSPSTKPARRKYIGTVAVVVIAIILVSLILISIPDVL